MLELIVRLVFSLGIVIGLMLMLAKVSARRFKASSGALVQVVQRQALSRSSAIAVVTVGERVLVLGTTEHQVSLLAELDPDEIEVPSEVVSSEVVSTDASSASASEAARPALVKTSAPGRFEGSVLSADTWKQALAAARRSQDREAS